MRGKNVDIVSTLVNNKLNVNAANDKGETPLHLAVEKGKLDVAKYLVNQGTHVTDKDEKGKTPQYLAEKSVLGYRGLSSQKN